MQKSNCSGGVVEEQDGNLHIKFISSCTAVPVSFKVTAQTAFGEAVYVIGVSGVKSFVRGVSDQKSARCIKT